MELLKLFFNMELSLIQRLYNTVKDYRETRTSVLNKEAGVLCLEVPLYTMNIFLTFGEDAMSITCHTVMFNCEQSRRIVDK